MYLDSQYTYTSTNGMKFTIKKKRLRAKERIQALSDQSEWWGKGGSIHNLEILNPIIFILEACRETIRKNILKTYYFFCYYSMK